MAISPASLQQRVPLVFASKREVERLKRYHHEYRSGSEAADRPSPLFGGRSLFRSR